MKIIFGGIRSGLLSDQKERNSFCGNKRDTCSSTLHSNRSANLQNRSEICTLIKYKEIQGEKIRSSEFNAHLSIRPDENHLL
jgi:hypothetical protein